MHKTDRHISTTESSSPSPAQPRRRHIGWWFARVALLLCFLAGFSCSVLPGGRAAARALAILPGILSASQPTWQAPIAETITHTQRTFPSSEGTVFLDIYAPSTNAPPVPGSREAMLVITGVGDNRSEPQVVNFLQTLARAGLVVMNVTTPALIADRVDAGDTGALVQAFRILQHWPGVGAQRVGMFGVSAGGALLSLAAASPQIRAEVAFLALLGSYFDTTTLLEALGRRALEVNGKLQPWHPVAIPLQALASTIAPALPGEDGTTLVNAFAAYPAGALTSAQLAYLAPESAAIYHLLAGDQPGRVAANLAALSPTLHSLLVSVSPASVVKQIHAPVYLLHDRNDQFVTETESREFAAALARLHHPYDFAEFGIFQHADIRANLNLSQLAGDGSQLFRLLSEVTRPGS